MSCEEIGCRRHPQLHFDEPAGIDSGVMYSNSASKRCWGLGVRRGERLLARFELGSE